MDNESYHTRKIDSYPTSKWKKAQLQQWLREKWIAFPKDMLLKGELRKLTKSVRDNDINYACDSMAKAAGHEVLKLPPDHSEYNPIKLIRAQLKANVAKKNK